MSCICNSTALPQSRATTRDVPRNGARDVPRNGARDVPRKAKQEQQSRAAKQSSKAEQQSRATTRDVPAQMATVFCDAPPSSPCHAKTCNSLKRGRKLIFGSSMRNSGTVLPHRMSSMSLSGSKGLVGVDEKSAKCSSTSDSGPSWPRFMSLRLFSRVCRFQCGIAANSSTKDSASIALLRQCFA